MKLGMVTLSVHTNSVIWLSFTPVLKEQVKDNSMMILMQNSYPPLVTILTETVLAPAITDNIAEL